MKAIDFEDKFDQDKEDIVDDLDLSSARRSNQAPPQLPWLTSSTGPAKR